MRPLQLQIEGINSFKQKQTINFEELMSGGLFGIFGPTGSGKSTVLDALFLALYGKMSRGDKKFKFINVETNAAFVSLVFDTDYEGNTYKFRVDRSYKAKNEQIKEFASFYKIANGEAELQTEVIQEVNAVIEKLVGMTYDDFKRCTSLSQGEFNSFLRETRVEQIDTIARIFKLEKFGDKLIQKIAEKQILTERESYALEAKLSALGDVSRDSVAAVTTDLGAKKEEYKKLKSEIIELTQTIATGSDLITGRKRFDVLNAAIAQYENQADANDAKRRIAQGGRRAQEIMPYLKGTLEKERQVLEFSNGLKALHGTLKEKTEYELAELKRYEQVKEYVYNEVLKQSGRKDKLEMLKPDVKRLEELKQHRDDMISEYGQLEQEMTRKTVERSALEELLGKSELYLEELSAEVANVSVSKEVVKVLSLARDIEIEKRSYVARIAEIEQQIKIAEKDKSELGNIIKKLAFDTNELKSKLSRADERIMAVYGRNETRFETLAMLANENVARHKAVELAKHINAEIKSLKTQNQLYAEKVEDYAKKSIKAIEIKTLAGRDKDSFEIALEDKIAERESYLGNNFLSIVTSKMDIGDNCPICENRIEKLSKDSRISLESFDNEIKVIKHKINQSILKHEEADGVRSELEARADELERLIEFNNNKISILMKERESVLSGYLEVRGNNEQELADVLKLSDEKVEKLEQLVAASNQLEKEVIENDKVIERKNAEYDALSRREQELRDDHERVNAVIGELSLQYLKYEEVLKGTSARTISDIIIDNDGKKARSLIKVSEQKEVKSTCILHIQELDSSINELKIRINSLSNQSDALDNERIEIQKRIAEYVPDGSTVEEEQAACQKRINDFLQAEKQQKAKYDNISRLIKLIDAKISEQNAMYRLMLNDLNDKKRESISQIKEKGFASLNEIKTASIKLDEIVALEKRVKEFDEELAKHKRERDQLGEQTAGFDLSEEELENVNRNLEIAKARCVELEKSILIIDNTLVELRNKAVVAAEIREMLMALKAKYKKLDKLMGIVGSKKLLGYVADDYIQAITDGASNTLLKLSNGRYYLLYEDDFFIVDNIAGGIKRDVNNLSGGESFLVSLSVSMAMSAAVSKISNRQVELFFLDEGFGTLDRELLETVSDGIERLGTEMSIGVISHVPELQDKINCKLVLSPANEKNGTKVTYIKA